jgi:hypothetical protein
LKITQSFTLKESTSQIKELSNLKRINLNGNGRISENELTTRIWLRRYSDLVVPSIHFFDLPSGKIIPTGAADTPGK